jgi:SAM-dependent methyltransferase
MPGHGWAGAGWIGEGMRGTLLGLWSAWLGPSARLDFTGAGEVPWSPPQGGRGDTTRGRRLDERPWYSGFFDHDYLRVFGPVLPEERTLALAEVARVLAPGGRFLLEVANREALVRGWHDSDVTRHDDGLVVLQERTLDLRTSRDLVRYTLLHPDGRRTSHDTSIRLYTLTELAAMVDRAGLELLAVSGDLDGGPLELDSSFVVALSGRAGKGIS